MDYSKDTIEALRSAYRSVYRKKLTVNEALKDVELLRKEFSEVDLFMSSIEESSRGISR
jgi:UDP-N-acetylglucosamine acyltransferase